MHKALIRIVDDDDVFRESLQYMLRAEGYEVTCYRNAREFLSQDSPSVFGLALLDYQMDGMDGIELQKELNRRHYPQPIIFLSAHGSLPIDVNAMKLGSFDFLEKSVDAAVVIERISEVLEAHRLKNQIGVPPENALQLFAALPERRREVALLLSKGMLKRQIAERLSISIKTVETHCLHIYATLNIHSVAELAAIVRTVEQYSNSTG